MIVGVELGRGPADAASQFGWIRAAASAARAAGFELIAPPPQQWLGEPARLQPMQTMAALAADLEGMTLSTGILLAAVVNPVDLAEQIVTLDHASGGRTVVEVGSAAAPGELAAFGVADEDVLGRTLEAIGLWRRLWSDDVVDHEGRFYRVPGARPTLRPFRGSAPPVAVVIDTAEAVRVAVDVGVGLSIDVGIGSVAAAGEWTALLRSEVGEDSPVVVRVDAASPAEARERVDELAELGCSHAIVRFRVATEAWGAFMKECHVVFGRMVGETQP